MSHPNHRALNAAYHRRKRSGAVVVSLEVSREQLHALERAGLLAVGVRDKVAVAWAAAQFLNGVRAFAEMGLAIYPPAIWDRVEADAAKGNN